MGWGSEQKKKTKTGRSEQRVEGAVEIKTKFKI